MSTYIEHRSNAFSDAMGDTDSRTLERKRSDSRLKKYDSCLDTRAWSIEDEQRRQYMLNLVRAAAKKGQICPKYVPVQVIIDLLLASKNAEIEKLGKQLAEFQRLYSMLEGGDDVYRLPDTSESEYGSTVADFDDIDHDATTLKETESEKLIALQAIEKLEGMNKIMEGHRRKLTHKQLKITSMQCAMSQQARVISSLHLLDLSSLEEEMAMLACAAYRMTPEDETENIRKQFELLKRYYDKISIMQDENSRLKKENAFYKTQLTNYANEESEIEIHTRMLEDELSRSFDQIRVLEDRVGSTRQSLLESAEMQSLRQRSQMLDEVQSEKNALAKRLERLNGIENKLVRVKARADEADMLEKENQRLLKELEDLKKYRKVSDYQAKDIDLLRLEARQSRSNLDSIVTERDQLKKKFNELTGCEQALRNLEAEHGECSCIKAERDLLKSKMPDVDKLRKELNEVKAELERKAKEEETADKSEPVIDERNMVVIEIEMVTLVEVIDDLSLERDDFKRRSYDLECIVYDQEDEIKTLISHVEQLSFSLQSGQDSVHNGLECILVEIEDKLPIIATNSYNELVDKLLEKENKIESLQCKLAESFDSSGAEMCKKLSCELRIVQEENEKLRQCSKRAAELCSSDHVGKLLFECNRAVAIISTKVKMRFSQASDVEHVYPEHNAGYTILSNALNDANFEISKLHDKLKDCEEQRKQEILIAENRQLCIKTDEIKCTVKEQTDQIKKNIEEFQKCNQNLEKENNNLHAIIKGIEVDLKTVRDQLCGTISCTCAASNKGHDTPLLQNIQPQTFIRSLQQEINSYIENPSTHLQNQRDETQTNAQNIPTSNQTAAQTANIHFPNISAHASTGNPCTMYDIKRYMNEKYILAKENVRLRSQISKIENEIRCLCDNVTNVQSTYGHLENKLKNLENQLNFQYEIEFEDCDLVEKLRSDIENTKCENKCLRSCLAGATGSDSFLEVTNKDSENFPQQSQLEGCELVAKLRSHLDDLKCENICLRNCLTDVTGSDSFLNVPEESNKNVLQKKKFGNEFVEKLQSDFEDLKCENECLRNYLKDAIGPDSYLKLTEENNKDVQLKKKYGNEFVEKLQSDFEDLKCENECLRKCLKDAIGSDSYLKVTEENNINVQEKKKYGNEFVEKVQSDLEDLKCENECLRKCLKTLTDSDSADADENEKLKAQVAELKETDAYARTCVAFGSADTDESTVDLLKHTVSKFQSDIEGLACENECLRANLEIYTNEYKELVDELECTKICKAGEVTIDPDELFRLKSINKALQSKIDELTEELTKMKKEKKKVEDMKEIELIDTSKYDDEIQKLKQQIKDLEKSNELLQTGLQDDSALAEYLKKIKELESKNAEFENLNNQLTNQLANLQREEAALSEKKDTLSDSELENEIRELKKKLNALENINKEQAKRINELEMQVYKLDHDMETRPAKSVHDERIVDLGNANLRITELEKDNDSLKKLIQKLQDQLHDLKEQNDEFKDTIDRHDESLDADGRIANLKAECDDKERKLRDEIERLKSKLNECESGKEANVSKDAQKQKDLQDEISKLLGKIKDLEKGQMREKGQMDEKQGADAVAANFEKEFSEREADLQSEIAKLKALLKDSEKGEDSGMENRINNLIKDCNEKEKNLEDQIAKLKAQLKDMEGGKVEKSDIGNRLASLTKDRDDRETDLMNEIAKLKSKIKGFESEGKDYNDREKDLLNEISKLKSLIHDLEGGMVDASEKDLIAKLRKEMEDKEKELLNQISKLKDRIKDCETGAKDQNDREKALQNELSKLKSKIMELEIGTADSSDQDNLLAKLTKERDRRETDLQHEINALTAQIKDFENYKREHNEKEKELLDQIAKLNAKIKELESMKGDTTALDNLIAKLEKEKQDREKELLAEISKLKAKIQELEDKEKTRASKEKDLQDEIGMLKSKIKDLDSGEKESAKEKGLQDELSKLNSKVADLENEKNICREKEKDLQSEIEKLKSKIKELESGQDKHSEKAKGMEDEIAKLNSKIKDLENELKKSNEKEKHLQDEIVNLKAKIKELEIEKGDKADFENQIASLKTRIKELENEQNKCNEKEKELHSEIAKLKAKIEDFLSDQNKQNQIVKDLRDEITKLKAKLEDCVNNEKKQQGLEKDLQDELLKLKRKMEDLTNEGKKQSEKEKTSQDEIAKLKAMINNLENESKLANQLEKQNKDLKDEIEKLKKQLADQKAQMEKEQKDHKDEIEKLRKQLADQKAQMDKEQKDYKDEVEKLKKQLADQKTQIEKEQKDSKSNLEAQIAKLTKERNEKETELQNELSKLKAQLKGLENADKQKTELEKQVKDMQNELDALLKKLNNLEDENKKLKKQVDVNADLEIRMANMTTEKNGEVKKLQDEISKLKAQINKLENENKELEKDKANKTKEITNLTKEIADLKQKLSDLEGKYNSQTKSQSDKAEKETNDLKKQIDELKAKLTKLEDENKNLKKDIENLNKSKADLEKENTALKQETQSLNQKINDINKENADLKKECVELKEKATRSEMHIENMNKKATESDQDSSKLRAEIESLKDKVKSLEKENADLKQKLEKCYEQNDITKSERDAMEKEKNSLQKDLEDLVDKIQTETVGDDFLLQRERDEKNKLNDLIKQLQSQIKDVESNQKIVTEIVEPEDLQKLQDEIDRLNKLREKERKELEQNCDKKLKRLKQQYENDVESIRKIQSESIISLESSHKDVEELQKLLAQARMDLENCKSTIKDLQNKLEAACKDLENERNLSEDIKKSLAISSVDTQAAERDTDDIIKCPCGAPISSRLYIAPLKDECICGIIEKSTQTDPPATETSAGFGDFIKDSAITINNPSVTNSLLNILTKAIENGLENLGFDEILMLHKKLKNASRILNRNVNICGSPQETNRYLIMQHIAELEKELAEKQKVAKEKLAALQVVITAERRHLLETKKALEEERMKYLNLVRQIDSTTREAAKVQVERDLLRQQSVHREDLLHRLISDIELYRKTIKNIEAQLADERANVKYLKEFLEKYSTSPGCLGGKPEKISKPKANNKPEVSKKFKGEEDSKGNKVNGLSQRTRSIDSSLMKSESNRLRKARSMNNQSDKERSSLSGQDKKTAFNFNKPKIR